MKKNKGNFMINIIKWKNGKLQKDEIEADSIEEAKQFIKVNIKGDDIKVKVYDEERRIHHSEVIKDEDDRNHHGHHGHDDDSYC